MSHSRSLMHAESSCIRYVMTIQQSRNIQFFNYSFSRDLPHCPLSGVRRLNLDDNLLVLLLQIVMVGEVRVGRISEPLQVLLRRRLKLLLRDRRLQVVWVGFEHLDDMVRGAQRESDGSERWIGGEGGGDGAVASDVEVLEVPDLRVEVGDGLIDLRPI